MKSIERNQTRVIVGRLFPNEDLIDGITEIIIKHDINSGLINVIGALNKCTLGYFNIETKEYQFKTFEEDLELISCMGNIAYGNIGPIIHLHVSLARDNYSVIPGHLRLEGEVRSQCNDRLATQTALVEESLKKACEKFTGASYSINVTKEIETYKLKPEGKLYKKIFNAYQQNGIKPKPLVINGATDAAVLNANGIETFALGAGYYAAPTSARRSSRASRGPRPRKIPSLGAGRASFARHPAPRRPPQ